MALLCSAMLFSACSGEITTQNAGNLPSEVADMDELETYECNSDVIGEVVYVADVSLNYECDGEKWFKSYDQTKKSSSSSKEDQKSESSSSQKADGSCSSETDEKSSSSGAHSAVNVKIMPSGTYDCSKYKCVTTENLNQEFLEEGKYGEFLDERDGRVYKTVVIGIGERTQTWMAQNMNYSDSLVFSVCYDDLEENCDKYGRLYDYENAVNVCPLGWHLPSGGEYGILIESAGEDSSLKSRDGWGGVHMDRFGFSGLPAGYSRSRGSYVDMGDESRFWTSSLYQERKGWSRQCATYRLSNSFSDIQGWYLSEHYSVRCIKDISERNPADTVVIKGYEGSYGTLIDERDGKKYKTVMMGHREWMAENLDYDTLKVSSSRYGGKFYDSLLITHVCPLGWHVPFRQEWDSLAAYVNRNRGNISFASAIKSTDGWDYHPDIEPGRDLFGFAMTPSGYIEGSSREGEVSFVGDIGAYWVYSYSEFRLKNADSTFYYSSNFDKGKRQIRCIKNMYTDYEYGSLKDSRDGKTYKTTKIGSQNWMAENLNYAYLEPIGKNDSSSFCLNNELDSCAKYGRLYLGDVIEDSSINLCPAGWHIPKWGDWNQLVSSVLGDLSRSDYPFDYASFMLRSTEGWPDGVVGFNAYGFSIRPSGYLTDTGTFMSESYACLAYKSSDEVGYMKIEKKYYGVGAYKFSSPNRTTEHKDAVAIRCVED